MTVQIVEQIEYFSPEELETLEFLPEELENIESELYPDLKVWLLPGYGWNWL